MLENGQKMLRYPLPIQNYGSQRVPFPLLHYKYPNCAPQDLRSRGGQQQGPQSPLGRWWVAWERGCGGKGCVFPQRELLVAT